MIRVLRRAPCTCVFGLADAVSGPHCVSGTAWGPDERPACLPTSRRTGARRVGTRLGVLMVHVTVHISVSGGQCQSLASVLWAYPLRHGLPQLRGSADIPPWAQSQWIQTQPDFLAPCPGQSWRCFLGHGTSSATWSQTESSGLGTGVCEPGGGGLGWEVGRFRKAATDPGSESGPESRCRGGMHVATREARASAWWRSVP